MLTNQMSLIDLEAVQAHIASRISGLSRPSIPATLNTLSGQVLRDVLATLMEKPHGRAHSGPFGTKEKLRAEITRLWPITSIELCKAAVAVAVAV
jgi:hypothetical protein